MRFIVAFIMLIAAMVAFWVNFNVIFDHLITCQPYDTPTLSNAEMILYIVGVLVSILISWLLSSFDHNMMSINFCGTRLYGRTVIPQGYIATKWLVLAGLPVIPVQSYEVIAEQYAGTGKAYAMNPLEDLESGQVARTAAIGYGILIAIELVFILFVNWAICW